MCLGNRAAAAAQWINSQIQALWDISDNCVQKHGRGIQHIKPEIANGTCLAQFGVGKHRAEASVNDLSFYTSFTAPRVTFICNHEVLIQFNLTSGHIRLESDGSVKNFKDSVVAFRLPFRQYTITDTTFSSLSGLSVSKAKFLIFELDSASFVRKYSRLRYTQDLEFTVADVTQQEIISRLQGYYLKALKDSGFHIIQSLPDFDNLQRTHLLDFSLVSDYQIVTQAIFNISIDAINTYLRARWLEAAGFVDDLEEGHDWSLFGHFALAEHRAICDDFAFHAYFGPPQVRALCSKEVIFIINAEELDLYVDGDFSSTLAHKFTDWKIAVIVDVEYAEERDGRTRPLWINFSSARFCEALSFFGSVTTIDEVAFIRIRTALITYFTTHYLSILQEYHHHYIHHSHVTITETEQEETVETIFVQDTYREKIRITNTYGFDILTAITQRSINDYFRSLWNAAKGCNGILSLWSSNEDFYAMFEAPQVQLPGNPEADSVILYVTMKNGSLTCVDRFRNLITGEIHQFSTWQLAFEVKVKQRVYEKSSSIVDGYFHGHKIDGGYVKNQLYLDFRTAKFRQDLSYLPGLFEELDFRLMRNQRRALLFFMQSYFADLKTEGYHILCTIPTWQGSPSFSPYALSTVHWQFYGESVNRPGLLNGFFSRRPIYDSRNMIIICGTMDSNKRPGFPLTGWSWHWEPCLEVFSGTVTLSKQIFLEGWLLKQLEQVNRYTTLIPLFEAIEPDGQWHFSLVLLANYERQRGRVCTWKPIATHSHALEFGYRNKDVWTYEHQGGVLDIYNGFYSVSSETVNSLFIPLVTKHGESEIKLGGQITLNMNFRGFNKSWSTKSVAEWSAKIQLVKGTRGRRGTFAIPSFDLKIHGGSGFEGDCDIVHPSIKDAHTMLTGHLQELETLVIDKAVIDYIINNFSEVWPMYFSGSYSYRLCNPVFNVNGDLLFDLQSPLDAAGHVIDKNTLEIVLPIRKQVQSNSWYQKLIETSASITSMISDTSVGSISLSGLGSSVSALDGFLRSPPRANSTIITQTQNVTTKMSEKVVKEESRTLEHYENGSVETAGSAAVVSVD